MGDAHFECGELSPGQKNVASKLGHGGKKVELEGKKIEFLLEKKTIAMK